LNEFAPPRQLNRWVLFFAEGMNRIVAPLVFLIALVSVTIQKARRSPVAHDDCPSFSVACPDEIAREGKTYLVKLRMDGVESTKNLSYKWSVSSGGEIVDGQGTPTLRVRCTHPEESITTTIEVGGLRSECPKMASCTFPVQ
jgi:hypothetical protein